MKGKGPIGQFANLETKLKYEIPMAVLLPKGGPVRPTISGTDCDGISEVDGIHSVYEVKSLGDPASEAQIRALKGLGDFFVGSRWLYMPLDKDAPAKSEKEQMARNNGYLQNATPVSATIWANGKEAKSWLERYLKDCGFGTEDKDSGGIAIKFKDAWQTQKTHVFRPTDEWLCIAHLSQYYADFALRGKYHYPSTDNNSSSF